VAKKSLRTTLFLSRGEGEGDRGAEDVRLRVKRRPSPSPSPCLLKCKYFDCQGRVWFPCFFY